MPKATNHNCAMHCSILFKILFQHFAIRKEMLVSSVRTQNVIVFRAICYHVLRTYHSNEYSLGEIGDQFGKTHATVICGLRAHESFYLADTRGYRAKFELIEKEYREKIKGDGANDDSNYAIIMKIDRIQQDLISVRDFLVRNFSQEKAIDPKIKEKIDSIPQISEENEQTDVLEKNIADGINIPVSNG